MVIKVKTTLGGAEATFSSAHVVVVRVRMGENVREASLQFSPETLISSPIVPVMAAPAAVFAEFEDIIKVINLYEFFAYSTPTNSLYIRKSLITMCYVHGDELVVGGMFGTVILPSRFYEEISEIVAVNAS